MYPLTADDAIFLVRKNFDEQGIDDSFMLGDKDSLEFEDVLVKTLPEAINHIHMTAPVQMLDGVTLSGDELDSIAISGDVLEFGIEKEFLRLVAFRASDSPYVVTEVTDEFSVEGRMQHNIYTRGTFDRPRLVLCQGKVADSTKSKTYINYFRYYSLHTAYTDAKQSIGQFEYIPRYRAVGYGYEGNVGGPYLVADQLLERVIDQLTGMMLAIYGSEKADYFLGRASFAPTTAPEA